MEKNNHDSIIDLFSKISLTNKLNWICWTEKSENIPFVSTENGKGDGENKIAAEFNTKCLGQNSCYDINIHLNDGTQIKGDVKKLDGISFNTGVTGRNYIRPIKNKIDQLLFIIKNLPIEYIKSYEKILNINTDEMSNTTIELFYKMCKFLNNKKLEIELPFSKINIKNLKDQYNNIDISLSIQKYYKICKILEIDFPIELKDNIINLEINELLNHEYILNPDNFYNDLNDSIKIFTDLALIFVDEKKGYSIIEKPYNYIKFERITRGHPRFKLIN
jgi:hypothetical protein